MMIPVALQRPRTGIELVRGFYQHGAGNCASIAAIKCAIAAFGVVSVYRLASENQGIVSVQQRDGFEVHLSADEIELAARRNFFAGEDAELLVQARFLFSVMAKRAQLDGNDGRQGMSYGEAIESLNDGEFWLEAPGWLGLAACVVHGPDRKLPNSGAAKVFLESHDYGVAKSAKHVWFASRGIHDEYGTPSGPRWSLSGAITFDPSKG